MEFGNISKIYILNGNHPHIGCKGDVSFRAYLHVRWRTIDASGNRSAYQQSLTYTIELLRTASP